MWASTVLELRPPFQLTEVAILELEVEALELPPEDLEPPDGGTGSEGGPLLRQLQEEGDHAAPPDRPP